jgi:hypothetical protein
MIAAAAGRADDVSWVMARRRRPLAAKTHDMSRTVSTIMA